MLESWQGLGPEERATVLLALSVVSPDGWQSLPLRPL